VPHDEYGSSIDLYIAAKSVHLTGDSYARWTYNGGPPLSGAMVVDAAGVGMRTWGWIGWRWNIPLWYAWHANYWHDRYNRKGAPLPGRGFDTTKDSVSFDDGGDVGNLDGVLALPGTAVAPCVPTLRLAALRRGLEDRALLDAASTCAADSAQQVAAGLFPTALGDAGKSGPGTWPVDEGAFEHARRTLIGLAVPCARR
jgi:hypothetical protein